MKLCKDCGNPVSTDVYLYPPLRGALTQFATPYRAIAQMGLVLDKGHGQLIYRFTDIIGRF